MSQGRGSARRSPVAAALSLCLVLAYVQNLHAATYTVGDSGGWTFNVNTWPNGKRFKAGDTLIFNYDATTHNVVAVDRASYSSCTIPAAAKVYTSGNDQVKLVKGLNFFACSIAGHCQSGMKIAIKAA